MSNLHRGPAADLPDQEELDPKAVKRALKKLKKQKKKDNDVRTRLPQEHAAAAAPHAAPRHAAAPAVWDICL